MSKKVIRITEGQLKKIIENTILKEGTWAINENDILEMIKELEKFKSKWWNRVGDDNLYDGIDSAIIRLNELVKDNY